MPKIKMKNILIAAFLICLFLCPVQAMTLTEKSLSSDKEKCSKKDANKEEAEKTAEIEEREWQKTKRQIQRNKKKYLDDTDNIFFSRVVDTVYIDIPG